MATTPLGLMKIVGLMTQGRRWGANLGLWAKIPLGFAGSARCRRRWQDGRGRPVQRRIRAPSRSDNGLRVSGKMPALRG